MVKSANKKNIFHIIPPIAQKYIQSGAPKSITQMTVEEIPPVAISWARTNVFPTGSWRNITPHYVKRLPPCRVGCPLGNDVEGWLEAVDQRHWDEAVRLLVVEQPLPAVCGRVCYHPCETACNRGQFDDAVSIREVERILGDRVLELGTLPEMRTGHKDGCRVRIVGSGPAGLATAWMLARLGHTVEIVERAKEPGGLLRYGIPAYRLPREILNRELTRFERMGIMIRCDFAHNPNEGIDRLKEGFDALFLAPGAAGHRSSGVSFATSGVVLGAIDFLAKVAADQAPHIGKRVVIIGGGNSAIDAARTALRLGADVTILYRRTRAEMPAYHEEVEAALAEGIQIQYLVSPDSIRGNNSGESLYLRCIRNELGEPDESGRRRPVPVPDSEFDLPIDNLIDAVGEFADPMQLVADKDEAVLLKPVDIWGKTGFAGIWVGGDFSSWDRTVAHAIGAGKRAAMSIDQWLRGNDKASLDDFLFDEKGAVTATGYMNDQPNGGYDHLNPVDYSDLNCAYFSSIDRNVVHEIESLIRRKDFAEVNPGLDEETVIDEAERCFHCGSCDSCGNCHVFCPDGTVLRDFETLELSFDLEHCKGCGVCASECPRAVIEMRK